MRAIYCVSDAADKESSSVKLRDNCTPEYIAHMAIDRIALSNRKVYYPSQYVRM